MTAPGPTDPGGPVVVERPTPQTARVLLNRPGARNALNLAMRRRLAAVFADLAEDRDLRAVVLAGNGAAFAAGADLGDFVEAGTIDIYRLGLHRLWGVIARFPRPIVAAVEGYALGGGLELAMHCDVIVAGAGARLGQTEVRVGLMPGAGGTQRLVRLIGRQRAMALLLTGDTLTGAQAAEIGLVARAVPDGEAVAEAERLAARIAGMPPLAIEQIKESVTLGEDAPLDTALALERRAFQILFASHDAREGMAAFLNKRQPGYRGN